MTSRADSIVLVSRFSPCYVLHDPPLEVNLLLVRLVPAQRGRVDHLVPKVKDEGHKIWFVLFVPVDDVEVIANLAGSIGDIHSFSPLRRTRDPLVREFSIGDLHMDGTAALIVEIEGRSVQEMLGRPRIALWVLMRH